MEGSLYQHIVDAYTISSSYGWHATPWNDASLVWLRLKPNGSGELTYGYGQTVYAIIKCRWGVAKSGAMRLIYLESPAYQHFQGFSPNSVNQIKDVQYKLTEEELTGRDTLTISYKYMWKMELSDSPWPNGLALPRKIPTTFYGHRQEIQNSAGSF